MKRKVYPSSPASKVYPGNNTNHTVLFVRAGIKGGIPIEGMADKSKELCHAFVRDNKTNSDYVGGKLVVIGSYKPKVKKRG